MQWPVETAACPNLTASFARALALAAATTAVPWCTTVFDVPGEDLDRRWIEYDTDHRSIATGLDDVATAREGAGS